MPADSTVIVLGSINTDLVIRGPKLPAPGETVLGGEFYQAAGGKGANQAVAAARAGRSSVTFLGAVGDDALGREALVRFRSERICCDFLTTVSGQPTGVALILVDEAGQNLISVASGANAHLTPAQVAAVPDEVFQNARVLLACLETPLATVVYALRRAREAGLVTILNPAPAPAERLPDEILELVDVLTPNETEAAALAGWKFATGLAEDTSQAREAALQLTERGCRSVIVTLGAQGCLVADREITLIPSRPAQAVDATAAGDAFNGALAVALAEGRPLVAAAYWAGAAAAISVTRRGAQPSLPTRDEIDRMLSPE